jgi:hypothetical protein
MKIPLEGMLVSGFLVRAVDNSLNYGVFPTVEAANAWAEMMTIAVTIEVVYAPTFNRG